MKQILKRNENEFQSVHPLAMNVLLFFNLEHFDERSSWDAPCHKESMRYFCVTTNRVNVSDQISCNFQYWNIEEKFTDTFVTYLPDHSGDDCTS